MTIPPCLKDLRAAVVAAHQNAKAGATADILKLQLRNLLAQLDHMLEDLKGAE